MNVTEIRPDSLMAEQLKYLETDINWLRQRKGKFVQVSCPACGSNVCHKAFEKFQFTYTRCEECETVYFNPRPTLEILNQFYAVSKSYWYWSKYTFPASEEVRRSKIFRPRVQRLVEICHTYKIPTDLLMEVGSGFGTFCDELRKRNLFKRIIAVEPTPDLAETCRKRGLDVIEKPIEQIKLQDRTVNVIVSFEVIEHLFSPKEFLMACGVALAPGGIMVLTCPNIKGFDVDILKEVSDTIDVEHLNYFHPASLSHLVSRCGFDVLEITTPGKLDAELVRRKTLEGKHDLSNVPFLKRILIDEWQRVGAAFQEFLADNGFSSHMWLVARKQ